MIFVWSDTHFNHKRIMEFCPKTRPFVDVDDMNLALIARWNSVVGAGDDIYLLGDFAMNARNIEAIFAGLNGRKHLVLGNHDEHEKKTLHLPWESKHDIVTLREGEVRAVACHYPIESWKKAHKGYLMLHGHSHGSLKRQIAHRFDVGVDVEPVPISLQALGASAAAQAFDPADHHGDA